MIQIDLRTDLAKCAPEVITVTPDCRYTMPCAIGAMMSLEDRNTLAREGKDTITVYMLLKREPSLISAPLDQHDDLDALQTAFDSGDKTRYAEVHAQLTEKYK